DPSFAPPPLERLDDDRSPETTFCTRDADSSQLAAVYLAAEGKSFVLEGPPGTGKSQTITNMIAQCLAQEKTVLFVSEKMAALDVVKRRLEEDGLGPFCLELHSNKANKTSVLGQLGRALETVESFSPGEWRRQAERLRRVRRELNEYVRALHRSRSCGLTVFQALSELSRLRETPRVDIRFDRPEGIEESEYAELETTVYNLASAAEACSNLSPGGQRQLLLSATTTK